MRANWIVAASVVGAIVPAVMPQNQITVWYATGTYIVEGDQDRVTITSPGEFKIQATDGAFPGDIQSITVATGVVGPVTVSVVHQNGGDGAQFLGWIDLSNAASGTIAELRVEDDLGTYLSNPTGEETRATSITGPFHVGSTITEDLVLNNLPATADIDALSIAADITIAGSGPHAGDISARFLWGDYTIDIADNMAGTITLGQPMCVSCAVAGTVDIEGDASDITIEAYNGLSGSIIIGRDLLGTLHLDSNPAAANCLTGDISIGRDLVGTLSGDANVTGDNEPAMEVGRNLTGRIALAGDVERPVEIIGDVVSSAFDSAALLSIIGSVSDEIRIYGSLFDKTTAPVEVALGGLTSSGAITVDWDGHDLGDDWESGAIVQVGPTPLVNYTGNTPSARVYEVTCPKGDVNNDNVDNPDFNDINPFVTALNESAYAAAFPGLTGSRVYHADCNCDGDTDFDDINAFVLRLQNPTAWHAQYNCETCPARAAGGEDGVERLPEDPYAAAEVFLAYLADEQLETFAALVEQLVEHYADTPRGEFWSAVLEVLHAAQ